MSDSEKAEPNLSRCNDMGHHAYMAGPCFSTREQAMAYRDQLDAHGITWKSQYEPWPPLVKR